MQSIYSKQAFFLSQNSPAIGAGRYDNFPSSHSSGQSISIQGGNNKRSLVMNGINLSHLKQSSNISDAKNTTHSVFNELDEFRENYTISPALKYREIRNELRFNHLNGRFANQLNSAVNDNNLQIRPIPKSYKSSLVASNKTQNLVSPEFSLRQGNGNRITIESGYAESPVLMYQMQSPIVHLNKMARESPTKELN